MLFLEFEQLFCDGQAFIVNFMIVMLKVSEYD